MSLRYRVLLAVIIGLISALFCYRRLESRQNEAGDFTFTWRAAGYLLLGENPYKEILPEGDYPFQTYLYYPLTAVLASLPFVAFPPYLAGAAFFGMSSALLAFAVSAQGWKRLPIFLSAPYFVAAATVQWSPLLMAAALLPPLAWLLSSKPNLGIPLFLYKPTWLGLSLILAYAGLSYVVLPSWPMDWLGISRSLEGHPPPLLVLPYGPLLLLGAVGWRKPEGRLFLGLSFFPQLLFFYDQLPLWLLPGSFLSSISFSALSWLAYALWRWQGIDPLNGEIITQPDQYIMLFMFLPALGLLLWQEKSRFLAWKKRFTPNDPPPA